MNAASAKSAPTKSAPAVPVWHCELKPLDNSGAALPPLTVGAKFSMNCSGDIPVAWQPSPHVVLPEKALPGSLAILEAGKLESTTAEFVVTSYRTGDLKPEYIRVMTGDVGFEASGLEWKVQSVLKQDQQRPPQPYPPYGPFSLPLPLWVWIAVALLVATVSSALWLWFKRIQDRRQLADDLAKHAQVATGPSAQFHKELRMLSRKLLQSKDTAAIGEWNAVLDNAIRIFLLREYEFLTLKVSRGHLLGGLKKKNREAYNEFSGALEKVFSEMDRFQTYAKEHAPAEYEQILNLGRQWADKIDKKKAKRV